MHKDSNATHSTMAPASKIPPQLLSLWNKELARLHQTLTTKDLSEQDRAWVKAQIEQLHSKIFD